MRSANTSVYTLSELLCAQELESQAPQGGNHGEEHIPHRFDLFPGLGIKLG